MKSLRNNKDLFDDQEVPQGHLERFEALLDKQIKEQKNTQKKAIRIKLITSIAAIAACIALIVFVSVEYLNHDNRGNDVISNLSNSSEFAELNNYYQKQMDEQIALIICKAEQADAETEVNIKRDVQKIMEENQIFIQDISQSENQELALFYVVQHYDRNLEILSLINSTLESHFKC